MSSLVLSGGVDPAGAPVTVAISAGVIAAEADGPTYDARGLTVAPGLIDLQVNGAVGLDLTAEPDRLWDVAAALPRYGVTAFAPTVITSSPDARARAMAVLAGGPPADWVGATPLGLHFEGPMIAPARKGAHPPQWLADPALDLVADWSRASGVLIATVAPELPGALDVIRTLAARDVVVSVGHTEADTATVLAAVDAGARMITHLGNAMPPPLAREPGPIGVALGGPAVGRGGLVAGVIADGHHLDALMVSAAWRGLGPGRFLAVTDTTAALGMPDGPARLGDQDVLVENGRVTLADGTIAGSGASLPQCLRFLRASTDCSLAEAIGACTSTAAAVIGDPSRGRLGAGARGDLALLDEHLNVVATVVGGRLAHGDLPLMGGKR